MMKRILTLVLMFLAACSPMSAPTAVSATLIPYETLSPVPPSFGLEAVATAAEPLPTPEPFTYTVQAGDTLGGIALKFGVSIEDLQAANSGVSPNAMSIGQVLKIPSDPSNPSGEPTPTPAPFTIEQVACYPQPSASMWCLVLAHNDTPDFYENVSAQVTLLDAGGAVIQSDIALLPLNLLPPGASLPLSVFFPSGVPKDARPQVQVLTAIRLLPGERRYLPASVQNALSSIDWHGRSAQVSGQITLPAESKAAASVWVAATAYDSQGRVVGFRRWEGGPLQPSGSLRFSTTVYSLAGPIDHLDLAVEARP